MLISTFAATILVASAQAGAPAPAPTISVDDQLAVVTIEQIGVAPDGEHVAALYAKSLPRENAYELTLAVVSTAGEAKPMVVAKARLQPDDAINRYGGLVETAGQFFWSPDSQELLYTVHTSAGTDLRRWSVRHATSQLLMTERGTLELAAESTSPGSFKVLATDVVPAPEGPADRPADYALPMKDNYWFVDPGMPNPKLLPQLRQTEWTYRWGADRAEQTSAPPIIRPSRQPREAAGVQPGRANGELPPLGPEMSHDGRLEAIVARSSVRSGRPPNAETYRLNQVILRRGGSGEVLASTPPALGHNVRIYGFLGWTPDDKELLFLAYGPQSTSVYGLGVDGRLRLIHEESGLLVERGSQADPSMSADGRVAVLVRNSNLIPDELVRLDLRTGATAVLFAPNAQLEEKARGITIRNVSMPSTAGDIPARLYLPPGYDRNHRYPLLFTNTGEANAFQADEGGEVPALALATHGIAVLVFSSYPTNMGFGDGDFEVELSRVERPRLAMEQTTRGLAQEGVIDPDRVGVVGLSYAAEIAMYAYWKSSLFRAVSTAGASLDPNLYFMGGLGYADRLDGRGFRRADKGDLTAWKRVSAALNARPTLPPLLWQTADAERLGYVQAWFQLRRAGAPVEWLEYTDENHVKHGPANMWWINQRNLDWFRFWLQDYQDPDPAKAEQYGRWNRLRALRDKNAAASPAQ